MKRSVHINKIFLSPVLICAFSLFTITAQSQQAQIKVDAGKVFK
jgi:hypothetical protein